MFVQRDSVLYHLFAKVEEIVLPCVGYMLFKMHNVRLALLRFHFDRNRRNSNTTNFHYLLNRSSHASSVKFETKASS